MHWIGHLPIIGGTNGRDRSVMTDGQYDYLAAFSGPQDVNVRLPGWKFQHADDERTSMLGRFSADVSKPVDRMKSSEYLDDYRKWPSTRVGGHRPLLGQLSPAEALILPSEKQDPPGSHLLVQTPASGDVACRKRLSGPVFVCFSKHVRVGAELPS